MNRLEKIDQFRNCGIKASTILDEMTVWFSEDDIEKFHDDFVRVHEVVFGEVKPRVLPTIFEVKDRLKTKKKT